MATCPASRPNDQGTCVTRCIQDPAAVFCCPPERLFIDQGTCVAVCPAERPLVDQGTCLQLLTECHNCVAACPADRPFSVFVQFAFTNLLGYACYERCPEGFPDTNGDMVCGDGLRKPFEQQIVRRPN